MLAAIDSNESDAPLSATQFVRWQGMAFSLAAGCEIAQHATDDVGHLVFVEGAEPRFTLNWAKCASKPDLHRLRQDVISQAREADRKTRNGKREAKKQSSSPSPSAFHVDTWQQDAWFGLRLQPSGEESATVRLIRYDDFGKRLIEFGWTEQCGGESPPASVSKTLASFSLASDASDFRRMTAFGLNVNWPEGWELAQVRALVGEVVLTFVPQDQKSELPAWVRVRRLRMDRPDDVWAWLNGKNNWQGWAWEALPGHDGVRMATCRTSWMRRRRLAVRSWYEAAFGVLVRVEAEGSNAKRDRMPADVLGFDVVVIENNFVRPSHDTKPERPAVGDGDNPLVVANREIRTTGNEDDVVLMIPIRKRWWMRGPLGLRDERPLRLDAAGAMVWQQINDAPSGLAISELAELVAGPQNLGKREADLIVRRFVQQMGQHGLIRLVGINADTDDHVDVIQHERGGDA